MMPSDARKQLLSQHHEIRQLLGSAAKLSGRLIAGGVPDTILYEFRRTVLELRRAFAEHNADEERLLEPLLAAADAWGPARVARMFEEHTAEHTAFREALAGDDFEVARRMADLAEDLDAHMMAEERTILNPQVMHDDLVTVESSS